MHKRREENLLIIGNQGGTNVGGSFLTSGKNIGLNARLIEMNSAMDAPVWIRRFNWWVRGRRPTWLGRFSRQVVQSVLEQRPDWLLATGTVPLNKRALEEIGRIGVKTINYLTDDPWNPAHRAYWFLEGLPLYDHVFSPRRTNLHDLAELGCRKVSYLPFAYDESLFYAEPPATPEEEGRFCSDVVFAGGADSDRMLNLVALAKAGFRPTLYGDYWDRFPETSEFSRGYADPRTLRKAVGGAKVALCLVRRANRDGHSMRTFEVPAIGACMLAEDTEEHREIFGGEGEAVVYFGSAGEMVEKLRWLLAHDDERRRLAQSAHQLITCGRNTYKERLLSMLGVAD